MRRDLVSTETMAKALVVWERLFGGSRADRDAVLAWTATLQSEGVTEEEFAAVALRVQARSRFWPKPVDLVEAVEALRAARDAEGRAKRLAALVEVELPDGTRVLAAPERALALPAGPSAGAPPADEAERGRRVYELTRRNPKAARLLLRTLREGGQALDAEVRAYQRAMADRDAERQAADEEQSARVRAQAAALRNREGS